MIRIEGGGEAQFLCGTEVQGTGANETFTSIAAHELFTGGGGDDLFVFLDNGFDDAIADFSAGAGSGDRIDVSAFGFTDLDSLLELAADNGNDTILNLDADDTVRLLGVRVTELHQDDFIFA